MKDIGGQVRNCGPPRHAWRDLEDTIVALQAADSSPSSPLRNQAFQALPLSRSSDNCGGAPFRLTMLHQNLLWKQHMYAAVADLVAMHD
jgi:hypothetical protein